MREFIHARDVADLTLRAILNGKIGDIYHFSPNDGLRSIADVVRLVCDLMNCKFDKSVNLMNENFGQDSVYSLDASKAKSEFGWEQQVSFENGIRETIKWIDANWEFIKNQPLEYIHKN
jgi:dTDP-glucose 4,6-dehydratase